MVLVWGRWDFAIDLKQWMIGFNVWDYGANVFFLCFRIGRNLDGYLGYDADDLEPMCPNCVTPWKCNGPHIPDVPSDRTQQP